MYLRDMPFFAGEDPSVVMELAFCMERCCVGPDEDVIRIGDEGHEMYFILEGRVEVLVQKKGLMSPIAVIGKEEFFGEMALLEPGHVRTANIRTLTFCEFRVLSADAFNVIASRYPMFGKSLKSIVRDRKSLRSQDFAVDALNDEDPLEPDDLPPEIVAATAANNAANRKNGSSPSKISMLTSGMAVDDDSSTKGYDSDQKSLPSSPFEETKDEQQRTSNNYNRSSLTNDGQSGGRESPPNGPRNVRPRVHSGKKQLGPLDLNNMSSLTPGALTPNTPVKPNWGGESRSSTPGPLTAPLKDSTILTASSRGDHMDKQYTDALQSIFSMVCSLKDQQKEFSNNILHKMDVRIPTYIFCVCVYFLLSFFMLIYLIFLLTIYMFV